MKEEEKIENARVKRRNPATEEKIMLNIFKYTIPKETLHFLRFSKLMYYQIGGTPHLQYKSHRDDAWLFPFAVLRATCKLAEVKRIYLTVAACWHTPGRYKKNDKKVKIRLQLP